MRLLVITDYIVDEQKVFHGEMPKEDNKLLNQLFNRIKTHNVIDLITINRFPIFKVYSFFINNSGRKTNVKRSKESVILK